MYGKHVARALCATLTAGALMAGAASAASAATLNGAGSTLVAPIEAEWATHWEAANSGDTVVYQPIGSGKGYAAIAAGTVDFGASDAPISAYATPCPNCIQIPWALSATGLGYNLPGVKTLHLTGGVIAQIYLGQITNWSDKRIKKLNKHAHLPNLAITPVWRNDGSGDSYAFTDYESKVSSSFRHAIGVSTLPTFHVGVGAHGNTGMIQALQAKTGTIAYVAVSYLVLNWPHAVAIKNAAGNFTAPNFKAIQTAASEVKSVPANNLLDITNPPKRFKHAYPISTFTYVIAPTTAPQGALLRSFIHFAINQGQAFGPALFFVKLPAKVKAADQRTLGRIQ